MKKNGGKRSMKEFDPKGTKLPRAGSLVARANAFRSDASMAKLPPRLQRTLARVEKAGKDGLGLDKLDRDERWDARILVKLEAIRAVAAEPEAKPNPKAKKRATVKSRKGRRKAGHATRVRRRDAKETGRRTARNGTASLTTHERRHSRWLTRS